MRPILDHLYDQDDLHCIVLFEIASPIMHTEGNERAGHHTRRWMLWNMAQAARLHLLLKLAELRVAPSAKWTKGYGVKERHAIAGADAKNKDLRECQTMLEFYRRTPEDWVSFPDYLDAL